MSSEGVEVAKRKFWIGVMNEKESVEVPPNVGRVWRFSLGKTLIGRVMV